MIDSLRNFPEHIIQMWMNLIQKIEKEEELNPLKTFLVVITYMVLIVLLCLAAESYPALALLGVGVYLFRPHLALNTYSWAKKHPGAPFGIIFAFIAMFMWLVAAPNLTTPVQAVGISLTSTLVILFHVLGSVAFKRLNKTRVDGDEEATPFTIVLAFFPWLWSKLTRVGRVVTGVVAFIHLGITSFVTSAVTLPVVAGLFGYSSYTDAQLPGWVMAITAILMLVNFVFIFLLVTVGLAFFLFVLGAIVFTIMALFGGNLFDLLILKDPEAEAEEYQVT